MGASTSRRIGQAVVVIMAMALLAACAGAQMAAEAPTAASSVAGAPVERPAAEADAEAPEDGQPDGALIVRTGELMLEVADVDVALSSARSAIADLGGYVAGSETQDEGEQTTATIVYRVPVARWDDAVAGLRALAVRVIQERTESAEVTDQVVDLEARLANLRASETALQAIMDRATSIKDVLDVQARLTEVRGEIERLTAQKLQLEERAALSTLTATWVTPAVAVTTASRGWDLGTEVDRALAQTIRVGQATASFLVWLVLVGLPVLIPLGVLTWLVVRLARRWASTRPARPHDPLWGPGGGVLPGGPAGR
jgi:hypothetical protein